MSDRNTRTGLMTATVTTLALGAAVVAAAVWSDRGARAEGEPEAATVEYGRRLLRETGTLIGPDHPEPARRYSGTRMACAACHLEIGTEPGTLTLLTAAAKYPRFSGRDGGDRDLVDRINGCMQRSMSGRALPRDSVEMTAMVAYITRLGAEHDAMGETRRRADEQPAFVEPDRAASPEAGRLVFERRCALCHGADGAGLRDADAEGGYVFPPLWGPDSYNDGAGMHRVLTAASFIKARMPLGEANLTDDEAYDVTAYINSHPRPAMAELDRDYPDRTTKPIDSPYPPWADPFPAAQHKYGPFGPIRQYYKNLKAEPPAGGR
jgi:thiosulfate dehydrogenase